MSAADEAPLRKPPTGLPETLRSYARDIKKALKRQKQRAAAMGRPAVWVRRNPVPDQPRGWGTMRRYGLGAFQPFGNFSLAASSETEEAMMTSSPCFQLTGVATECFAVS